MKTNGTGVTSVFKKLESEKHNSWSMPAEEFKGQVATDGSLLGAAEKRGVCGWSVCKNWSDSPKTQNQNRKRDNNRDSDDRLRDLPEWLEEFKDNLEDTGTQDSDSGLRFGTFHESAIKIKEAQYPYSPSQKTEIAQYACGPK